MIAMMHRPVRRLGILAVALTCAASTLGSGCAAPKQDDFRDEGGISPDPTGIIAGSVLYVGPRPSCEYDKAGKATRVRGRVLLTLFHFDDPPPPEGRATSALNLKAMNGSELFATRDCLPEGQAADPSERITRSVEYSWPQIALGPKLGSEVVYQIRGFYDADEDMNPFFSVKNLPTAGDIAGGAVADVQDASKGFLRITLPSVDEAQNGFRRSGVIVALGNYVWLERPAFQLSAQNRYLDSRLTVQGGVKAGLPDTELVVRANWTQLCEEEPLTPNCGPRLEQLDPAEVTKTFKAGNIQLDFSPERYTFISEPVDILTVNKGSPTEPVADVPGPDGVPDPHPLLGGTAFAPWYTPIVIMTRAAATPAQAVIEAKAGIPNVRLIGSPLLNAAGTGPERRTRLGDMPISVPPIAAVELDPLKTECRVPYIAPGNFTVAYEARFTYCHELPTGIFGVSAIQGVAGGTRDDEPDSAVSDTGYVYNGGRLSGQAWTLPNDLASEDQVGQGNALASQGLSRMFIVHENPAPATRECGTAFDPLALTNRPVEARGLCGDGDPLIVENDLGFDGAACLPKSCCEGIDHLCGVPLCEFCSETTCPGTDLGERLVRSGPTKIVETLQNGKNVPDCIPFEMPTLCCDR